MALNKIQTGFKVYEAGAPIDSRFVVANSAALAGLNVYDGLIAYVKDVKKFVFYSSVAIDGRDTLVANWYELDKDTHVNVDSLFKSSRYEAASNKLVFTKNNDETIDVVLSDLINSSALSAITDPIKLLAQGANDKADTIDSVKSGLETKIGADIATAKQGLENKIGTDIGAAKQELEGKVNSAKSALETKIGTDIGTAKQEINGTIEGVKSDLKAAKDKLDSIDAVVKAGPNDLSFSGLDYADTLAGSMVYADGRYTATFSGTGKPYLAFPKKMGKPKSIGFVGSINEASVFEVVEKNQGGVDYFVYKSTVSLTLDNEQFEVKF